MGNATCSIEGCNIPRARQTGWCRAHHERWRKTGDVQAHFPLKGRPRPETCILENCDAASYQRMWCQPHYRRWKEYGNPLGISPQQPCAWPEGCPEVVWTAKSRSGMCAPHAARTRKREKPADPKLVNERNRQYARKHPEKVAAWNKKWRDANPDKQRHYRMAREARLRGSFVERVYRSVVFRRDRGICGICGKKVDPAKWHLDHIVPISRGRAQLRERAGSAPVLQHQQGREADRAPDGSPMTA